MATPIPRNLCPFTLAEIARATGGALKGEGSLQVRGVCTDSRTIEPGALFVALRGATHDGHSFLPAAVQRGAAAALVEPARPAQIPSVEVDDTLAALGQLARYHVDRVRAAGRLRSVAIGGAAGKTTTKELVAAVMQALFGTTLATPGNLNNLVGVPMTLFMLGPEHRAMVIECGTNTRGEIARLGAIVSPDVALVLNVDIEHTEGLGTIEGVADEEAALLRTARRAAVFGADEPMLAVRLPQNGLRLLSFGESASADVRLLGRRVVPRGRCRITIGLGENLVAAGATPTLELELALPGAAAALNACAAVAAAAAVLEAPLGTEQLGAIGEALSRVQAVPGRLSTRSLAGLTLVDDTYNANPRSVRVALAATREIADALGARMVVALGDMLELGALSPSMHAAAVADVIRAKPAVFLAVGREMLAATASAASRPPDGAPAVLRANDSEEAAQLLLRSVRKGDVVLVKGSRGIRMERLIEGLERAT